jgi:hypothetical protein
MILLAVVVLLLQRKLLYCRAFSVGVSPFRDSVAFPIRKYEERGRMCVCVQQDKHVKYLFVWEKLYIGL